MKQKDEKILLVIGGPGGSGSSTISKMLSEHFSIERIYAGDMFRKRAKQEQIESFEEFLQDISDGGNSLDLEIDSLLMEYAKRGNVLIESKVFGALAKKKGIPCTATVWLHADINTRVKRKLAKEGATGVKGLIRGMRIKRNLNRRYRIDREKYLRLYDIKYDSPRLYYDIVLDTSRLNEVETFNLILERLKDGRFI
ncbi:MAG: AAA family ATPase [Candidatus Dojkabacteria bacterium]|jgi:cytidylate kinase|nr:AAA family ATPase [Candidatus Dojkabacteria bacterium]